MSQDSPQANPVGSPPLPPPPRRRRWVTVLLMLLVFGCGLVVGGGATLKFIDNRLQEAIHHPERMPERVAGRLQNRLDLSSQQRAEVQEILQKRQRELMAIRRDVQPQVEAILDGIEADVAGVLRADQKERWLRDAKRFRERFTPPMPAR